MKYTNDTGIPLSLAVMLAYDDYDYDPNTVSVTRLIKPLKEIILSQRVPEDYKPDISGLVKSTIGTAIHDYAERAWKLNYEQALLDLGYPQSMIDRVVLNPEGPYDADALPIYLEKRTVKEISGFKIGGKFDKVIEGQLRDYKSTSTYTYIKKSKDKDYQLQGSIYRWLNQDIITNDTMVIDYIFLDWANKTYEKDYPPSMLLAYEIPLLSIAETELYIEEKLLDLVKYADAPEEEIPPCTDEDLWRDPPVYKYYKNPEKRTRATRNYDSLVDANQHLIDDGNVGIVVTVPGKPVACRYCSAAPVCQQAAGYIADGTLTL